MTDKTPNLKNCAELRASARLSYSHWATSLRIPFGIVAAASLAMNGAALAYSLEDAKFLTDSKNKAVLRYIVCLEQYAGEAQNYSALSKALDLAISACRPLANKLPLSANEPSAEDIKTLILECGFKPGGALGDAEC